MGLSDKIEEKERQIDKTHTEEAKKIAEKARKKTESAEQEDVEWNETEKVSEDDEETPDETDQNVKTNESDASIIKDFNSGEKSYQTEMDSMYNLVKSAKRIKLREAAKMLNISNERAEEWAEILTRHKLITMHYPAIGPIELRAIGYRPRGRGLIGKIKSNFENKTFNKKS